MLIHILAEEDYLSTYPRDGRKIAWSLCSLLAPTQQSPTLTIEVGLTDYILISSITHIDVLMLCRKFELISMKNF